MPKKCDFCGRAFDEDMTVNVCQNCGATVCSSCCSPINRNTETEGCPICESGKTVPQEEIQETIGIDEQIKDSKGYE